MCVVVINSSKMLPFSWFTVSTSLLSCPLCVCVCGGAELWHRWQRRGQRSSVTPNDSKMQQRLSESFFLFFFFSFEMRCCACSYNGGEHPVQGFKQRLYTSYILAYTSQRFRTKQLKGTATKNEKKFFCNVVKQWEQQVESKKRDCTVYYCCYRKLR